MSIASEITRINNNIASAYTAIGTAGGTVPASANSANLATAIASIPSGGGGPTFNFTEYGNPYISYNEYIASNFSSSTYLVANQEINFQNASTWEFVTRILKPPYSPGSSPDRSIICGNGMQIGYQGNSNNYWIWLWPGIGEGSIISYSSAANDMMVKVQFTGTQYVISYSNDNGTTWTQARSFNSSTKINNSQFYIGNANSSAYMNQYWPGGVGMKDTSIKVDGVEVWKAVTTQ